MTFEEWWDTSSVGKEPKYKDRKLSAGVAWKVGYYQAIVDCYGEAAAPLVLESLRKASNRPAGPFSSGGEGKGSQTAVKEPQVAQPSDMLVYDAIAANYSAQPLTDDQIDAAISAWFTYEQSNVDDHRARMRRAIAAAMSKGA